jgi:hypothetical protein
VTADECKPVTVSRRIDAPAHEIFRILADPGRHSDLDGSGMLRGPAANTVISGVGDVFVMKMHYPALGDYEMNNHIGHPGRSENRWGHRWSYELIPDGPHATIVTEIYDCSRAPEEQRVGMDNGNGWIETMTRTLERLEGLCALPSAGAEGAATSG